jgi:hypothetical protein
LYFARTFRFQSNLVKVRNKPCPLFNFYLREILKPRQAHQRMPGLRQLQELVQLADRLNVKRCCRFHCTS